MTTKNIIKLGASLEEKYKTAAYLTKKDQIELKGRLLNYLEAMSEYIKNSRSEIVRHGFEIFNGNPNNAQYLNLLIDSAERFITLYRKLEQDFIDVKNPVD